MHECAGRGKGSDHFKCTVDSLTLHFYRKLSPRLEPMTPRSQTTTPIVAPRVSFIIGHIDISQSCLLLSALIFFVMFFSQAFFSSVFHLIKIHSNESSNKLALFPTVKYSQQNQKKNYLSTKNTHLLSISRQFIYKKEHE